MKHSKKSNVQLVWANKGKRDLIPFDYFRENRWKSIRPDSVHLVEDNFYFLSFLMHLGIKVNLIYIDPPFFTGQNFRTKSGELAYSDKWTSKDNYIQFMYERLILMRDLLADDGSIYVHCDWRMSGTLRMILDEVFGEENFVNEIIWAYRGAVNQKGHWNRKHDNILYYAKGVKKIFNLNEVLTPHPESSIKKYKYTDENGKKYRLMGKNLKGSPIKSARDVNEKWEKEHPELTFRHYLKDGILPVDYWNIDIINQSSWERIGFPTQKPEALLERIIRASSNPGDIVADFFMGSGTTCVVAKKLGRHYIGCDSSKLAYETTFKRLQSI